MTGHDISYGKAGARRLLTGRFFTFLALLLALLPRPGIAEHSVYTSLAKGCRTTTYQANPARQCGGVRGWRVLVVSEQERSYLALRKGKYVKSLRENIFSEAVGHFPDIYDPAPDSRDPVAEWRLDTRGQPRAMIFRVYALDPEKSPQTDPDVYRSRLIVVRLGKNACVLGIVADNEQARHMADQSVECGKAP